MCPYTHGIRQKESNINLKCVRRVLIRNVPHLWFASGFVLDFWIVLSNVPRFFPTRRNSAKHTAFSGRKCHNPWKSTVIQGFWCFTRRRTFRNSVKVQRTQRDKRGTRYTTLISAAATRLLHYFLRTPIPYLTFH